MKMFFQFQVNGGARHMNLNTQIVNLLYITNKQTYIYALHTHIAAFFVHQQIHIC
jgi:hypothetical protein